jgi:hypothetical protein
MTSRFAAWFFVCRAFLPRGNLLSVKMGTFSEQMWDVDHSWTKSPEFYAPFSTFESSEPATSAAAASASLVEWL